MRPIGRRVHGRARAIGPKGHTPPLRRQARPFFRERSWAHHPRNRRRRHAVPAARRRRRSHTESRPRSAVRDSATRRSSAGRSTGGTPPRWPRRKGTGTRLRAPIRFGSVKIGLVILPTDRWHEARRLWKWAEDAGFCTAWTYDHIRWGGMPDGPWHAAVPVLAAAAQ